MWSTAPDKKRLVYEVVGAGTAVKARDVSRVVATLSPDPGY
jgi:hypothetical protein